MLLLILDNLGFFMLSGLSCIFYFMILSFLRQYQRYFVKSSTIPHKTHKIEFI